MANEESVTSRINEKLTVKFPEFSDHCIFKVSKELRRVNEEAYEPHLIAIGPYHRKKDHLLAMEDHKIRYFQNLLQQSAQKDVSKYVQIIRNLEERARKCYAEPLSFDHDEFVEMMLIDGCFIIEFIRKWLQNDTEDPLLRSDHMLTRLKLDLLLLENQLPFFILQELLVTSNVIPNVHVTNDVVPKLFLLSDYVSPDQESTFISVILVFYKSYLPGPLYNSSHDTPENMIQKKNLLGLLYDYWQPPPKRVKDSEKIGKAEKRGFMRYATELKDCGIKFKSADRKNLFDIDFVNSTIKIPKIQIEDKTECVLRNLIAYEQLTSSTSPKYFIDYIIFMDSLIDSAKDVELLCRRGIIDNMKGDDESIAILFNKLGENVFYEGNLYADIVNNVNEHCKKRRNLWMAKLRHDYFPSPWSFISVLAAFILLVLTLIQTVFSVISYYK